MFYAKIVLALPVEGPFDYLILSEDEKKARPGMRAWVNFRGKKEIGYIVSISSESNIPRIKPLIKLIDSAPVLNPRMLKLSKMLSNYYYCSWGQAIAASLPEPLRKGKTLESLVEDRGCQTLPCRPSASPRGEQSWLKELPKKNIPRGLLLMDLDGKERWDVYAGFIKETLVAGKSVIVIVPNKVMVLKVCQILCAKIGQQFAVLYRQQPNELVEWEKIYNGQERLVVGTRSSIFAPLVNLGLIIIDEELDSVYKQEQIPHYHARQVALMRAGIEKARIIIGGIAVSLESIYLSRRGKIEFQVLKRKTVFPEIKIINMKNLPLLDKKKNIILSRLLQDTMVSVLATGGKIFLFLNRKGFATAVGCSTCGKTLRCSRCNMNLAYFFDQNILRCHYCNYKLLPPKICPQCNSGYIKFFGAGTEKVESELSRIFPVARVKRIDSGEIPIREEADIFISTQGIIHQANFQFELTVVLAIDNSLNHVDFRSSEKVFAVMLGLLTLTDKKMIIQTSLSSHYCFQAIEKNDSNIFYDAELKSRRQIKFPPYRNFCQVKLRGRIEEKVAQAGEKLFQKFSQSSVPKGLQIISLNPAQPPKLRGNYYWVILLGANNVLALNKFLKIILKDFRHSGIIVTVDVDPI